MGKLALADFMSQENGVFPSIQEMIIFQNDRRTSIDYHIAQAQHDLDELLAEKAEYMKESELQNG